MKKFLSRLPELVCRYWLPGALLASVFVLCLAVSCFLIALELSEPEGLDVDAITESEWRNGPPAQFFAIPVPVSSEQYE